MFGGFAGDVRVATGDFDGDGFADTVLVTGPGTKTGMALVSGKDNSVLLPPTVLMGGTFPVLVRAFVTSRTELGSRTGLLYFVP